MTSPKQPVSNKCPKCGGDISLRNPTGHCDHLYYPENTPTPDTTPDTTITKDEATNTPTSTTDEGEWEKRFKQTFDWDMREIKNIGNFGIWNNLQDRLIYFIRQEIAKAKQQERERVVEKVKKLDIWWNDETEWVKKYEVINVIKALEGEE